MKTCLSCGCVYKDNAIACAYCGGALFLKPDSVAPRKVTGQHRIIAISIVILAFAVIAYFVFSIASSPGSSPPNATHSVFSDTPAGTTQADGPNTQAAAPVPPPEVEPVFSGITVTPYQIMKNPFIDQGKLLKLDIGNLPIIADGGLMQYVHQSGRIGLILDRAMSPNQALYEIVGIDAVGNGNLAEFGQLVVDYPDQGESPAMDHYWFVMTEQPTQGTNGFGAPISVPTIKFVRLGPALEFGGPMSAN
jgi:DNA-directed RNA polymerase subunit RPC12/RpoP